jgi:hypothetical protein
MRAGSHVIFYRQKRGGKLKTRGKPVDTKKCPEHKTLSCRLNNLAITVEKEGGRHFTKASFPMRFGYYSEINIGIESVHEKTLASINKPLKVFSIREAFNKMLEINRQYAKIEVTANFLLGEQLLPDHTHSLIELLRDVPDDSEKKRRHLSIPINRQSQKERTAEFIL